MLDAFKIEHSQFCLNNKKGVCSEIYTVYIGCRFSHVGRSFR